MSRHLPVEALSAYLDGESSEGEIERVESHLDSCTRCSRRLEEMRRLVGELRSLERVSPPSRLGLELQSRLMQAVPPFEERGRRSVRQPRLLFQPAILATIGVVLALAVVTLLFLQALERQPAGPPPLDPAELHDQAELVVIGERRFRPRQGGWTEVGLSRAEVDAAEPLSRRDLLREPSPEPGLAAMLERLEGEVTLRLADGRVVRVGP
ncbi:MAG: zf-HC2 domain-containing protein [Thermoanaerobaculia bacterium]|nr:zf-HC2 domain-containing protein [Thermoanaerobaculia bacterium]